MSSFNETAVQPHFPASIETSIKDKNQQHHQQRSLPKGKIAKVEILPTLNAAWKQYKLSPDTNVCILSGSETGSSGVSANLMRNRKQLLSYCIAALSYIRVYSESSWKPRDIDKIADIAFNINRRTVMKRPMNVKLEQHTEFDEQTDIFYIDSIKFVTLTKASMASGVINKDDVTTIRDFFTVLLENGQQSCIVELNNNFLAFWHTDDKFYMFQTLNAMHKSSKCIQLPSFDSVQLYLQKFFINTESRGEYVFYTVDFLKINDNVFSREEILKNFHLGSVAKVSVNESIGSDNIPHKTCMMPTTYDPNATSFHEITEEKYILRCPKTIDRSGKMSSTCIAAIVVLRVIRAFLWTSDTLSDILDLGSKIFKENLKSKPKGQAEIRVADITGKIQFRSFECIIESQQMFFGTVESTVANICNIEQGLTEFFMSHIAGVIDGPNVVAVWKENEFYYMYDAKARNGFGVRLTKEETDAGETGMSCITRFKHLKDLAEVYIENVPKKERQDYYKITHIELKPFLGKNWYQWKVALPGQWCLRADECLQSKENLRVCVTAILFAENVDAKNWKTKTVDEIALTGYEGSDYFHGERNLKKTEMEIVLEGKASFVTINRKMFRYVVNALDKSIEDCLVKGFNTFFEGNKRGIFTFNTKRTWKYFSIWKSGGNWFAFGLCKSRNDATSDEKQECWCALRFTSPIDMAKSLTANIVIRKNQEFSLRSVTLNDEAPKIDKKKWKNFKPLKPYTGNGGILRIGKNFDLIGSEDDVGVIFARNTYNIAAVAAMTLMKDCWTWSNYDVWDILKISQKSFSDEVNKFENFYIKVGTTMIKLKDIQTNLWEKEIEMDPGDEDTKLLSFDQIQRAVAIKSKHQIERAIKGGGKKDFPIESAINTEDPIDEATNNDEISDQETRRVPTAEITLDDPLREGKLIIEGFMNKFKKHRHPNAILRSEQLQLAFWKKDGAFFVFDLRDADKTGCTNVKPDKSACPYVAWFDSMNGLLAHIYLNLGETESSSYELVTFKLKAKIVNSTHKTWYNFSLVDDTTDRWMIQSLYGNIHKQCMLTSCVIALVFASTLQPSNWNSSMLDSVLKYGRKLYKKSVRTNVTELKLTTIVTPFIIGCYQFSFTAALLKCGANEQYVLENVVASLFGHAEFGVISSKGYSVSIWQQNNSYFIFDPQLNGMASLTRYSNISLLCNHFLLHVRTGMTGVNVFEIFRISVTSRVVKKEECPVDIAAISKLTNQLTIDDVATNRTTRMLNVISDHDKWLEVGKTIPVECVLIAACAVGCHKNPEYWTHNMTEEILNLGESIYQTANRQLNLGKTPPKLDQLQGIYPFNAKSAIQIRVQLFEMDVAAMQNDDTMDATYPKTLLTEFFQLYDNAILSSKSSAKFTLTASKFGGRFYLFSCQPIDIDEDNANVNQSKGMLLPFDNVYELQTFLETHFGDGKSLEKWLEMKSLEIVFVPVECIADTSPGNATLTTTLVQANDICSSTLIGDLCKCSSDEQGHIEKHACLNLAAIILSCQGDVKTWTKKTFRQIETNGCALYCDARIEKKVPTVTIDEFPDRFYIDHVEWKTKVSKILTFNNQDQKTITAELMKKFKPGKNFYVSIATYSFCLISKMKDPIFYWYDPNNVEDAKKEIRASVCCFSSMDLVVGHILKICKALSSVDFAVNFIQCIEI